MTSPASATYNSKGSFNANKDFKIKKKVGGPDTRSKALSNSGLASDHSYDLADSVDSDFQSDSVVRLIEDSKIRRLQDAKRIWQNQGESSPFRCDF